VEHIQDELEYLPLFEKDISEARDYIAKTQQNPTAALNLRNRF